MNSATSTIGKIALLAGGLVNTVPLAQAEEPLSRGHRILIDRGLQIQATIAHTALPTLNPDYWEASHFTAINFAWAADASTEILQAAPSISWGRWGGAGLLSDTELSYLPGLVNLQYGDEQDLTDPGRIQETAAGFAAWRAAYPDVLVFADQNGLLVSTDTLRNYMQVANPDMLMFNFYPFRGEKHGQSYYMPLWYNILEKHRQLAAAGNDGTGKLPIPFGVYTQTWSVEGHTTSESEVRLNQFSAWTFGAKFASAWLYVDVDIPDGEVSTLFAGKDDAAPTPLFYQVAETNRQSLNLGPALVHLQSTGVRYIAGRHPNDNRFDTNGDANATPADLTPNSSTNGWGHSFITSVVVNNIGTTNIQTTSRGTQALAGDVVIGFFNETGAANDATTDETYFMVLNALSAPDASAEATQQRISIYFDFMDSDISALQRLSRLTGEVESVPLIHMGGHRYRLDLILDGGTADLFKFDTGTTFIPEPASGMSLLFFSLYAGSRRRHDKR